MTPPHRARPFRRGAVLLVQGDAAGPVDPAGLAHHHHPRRTVVSDGDARGDIADPGAGRGAYTTTSRRPEPVRQALPIHRSVSKPGSAGVAAVRHVYPDRASAASTWNPVASPPVVHAMSAEERQPPGSTRSRAAGSTVDGSGDGGGATGPAGVDAVGAVAPAGIGATPTVATVRAAADSARRRRNVPPRTACGAFPHSITRRLPASHRLHRSSTARPRIAQASCDAPGRPGRQWWKLGWCGAPMPPLAVSRATERSMSSASREISSLPMPCRTSTRCTVSSCRSGGSG